MRQGKSAYDIWLDNGHTGDEIDFLNSLKGEPGKPGQSAPYYPPPKNGKDGAGIIGIVESFSNDGALQITIVLSNKKQFGPFRVLGNIAFDFPSRDELEELKEEVAQLKTMLPKPRKRKKKGESTPDETNQA